MSCVAHYSYRETLQHWIARCAGDWSELTQLELIRLDQNALSGELPPSWSKLTHLRTLTLWDNRITGGIPDSWGDLQVGGWVSGGACEAHSKYQ